MILPSTKRLKRRLKNKRAPSIKSLKRCRGWEKPKLIRQITST